MPRRPAAFATSRFRRHPRPDRTQRLKSLPLNMLLPNALTVLNLCSGMTAIRFAIQGQWQHAVFAILVAALFDVLDGGAARLLKGQSKFGVQLDSLSDAVSFGVAPATVLYLWTLQTGGILGWLGTLALAVCCALRLARFNAHADDPPKPSPVKGYWFTGVPAPAGAMLALTPLAASLEIGRTVVGHPAVVALWVMAVSGLMVSTLPTPSLKGVRVPLRLVVPILIGVVLVATALVSHPWITWSLAAVAYLGSLPLALRRHRRLSTGAAKEAVTGNTPAPQ